MVTKCPCGGKFAWNWHFKRNLPQCDHSRNVRAVSRKNAKNGVTGWIPGTPISVPEFEEL